MTSAVWGSLRKGWDLLRVPITLLPQFRAITLKPIFFIVESQAASQLSLQMFLGGGVQQIVAPGREPPIIEPGELC